MTDSGSGGFACLPYCTGFRSSEEAIVEVPSLFSCAPADGDMRGSGRTEGAYGFIHESAMSVLLLSSHGRPTIGVRYPREGPSIRQISRVKWQSFVVVHCCSFRRNASGDLASGDLRVPQPVAGEGKCETLP